MKKIHHPLKWFIWAIGGIFYFYEYFLRVGPSIIVPELMSAFSANAAAVGALTAFYFYIYAPMQLPVGILVDRYGARRLLAIASLIAGLGAFFFAIAQDFWVAALGRFCMGAGSSFGFVGMIYICSHWFEEKKRGILIGLASSIGTLGAVMGEGPMRIGVNLFGWRTVNLGLAIFGVILAVFIFLIVRNEPEEIKRKESKQRKVSENVWKSLHVVCKSGTTWLNAIMSLFLYAATPAFAGLWAVPFIHSIYKIPIKIAALASSMIFVGWAVGGPLVGRLSDRLRQKKSLLCLGAFLGAGLISLVIYLYLPLPLLFFILFLIGCVSGAQLLNYSYAIDVNPTEVKGTAAAFTNFITVGGAAVIQPFIGYLLDKNWTGQMEGGIRVFSPEAYKIAMSFFPISFIIAFVLALFLKRLAPKYHHYEESTPSP